MPKLQAYTRDLPYTYALGVFPAMECLLAAPDRCRRLLLHSRAEGEGVAKLVAACEAQGIRVEQADRALARLSQKENCFAAMAFDKREGALPAGRPHAVLHRPADGGNAGTILRTCLGLGMGGVAIIRPAVDVYDPRVMRASMGALARLPAAHFEDLAAYRAAFSGHGLYLFMLGGAKSLDEAARGATAPYALVFGNEAQGLPPDFAALGTAVAIPQSGAVDSLNLAAAAAIGMYAFRQAQGAFTGTRVREDV
ncbi:MAG: TrmH family RNA methyltransferase [Oscillospiraceae bacterium]|jgi:TrmH family RNA methyltransferase|nr:TrmH family RNA methyltransferase [Oscillospiraceae bacterium]